MMCALLGGGSSVWWGYEDVFGGHGEKASSSKIEFDKIKTSIISANLFMGVLKIHKYKVILQKSRHWFGLGLG